MAAHKDGNGPEPRGSLQNISRTGNHRQTRTSLQWTKIQGHYRVSVDTKSRPCRMAEFTVWCGDPPGALRYDTQIAHPVARPRGTSRVGCPSRKVGSGKELVENRDSSCSEYALLAQWESACMACKRSAVRLLYLAPREPKDLGYLQNVTPKTTHLLSLMLVPSRTKSTGAMALVAVASFC